MDLYIAAPSCSSTRIGESAASTTAPKRMMSIDSSPTSAGFEESMTGKDTSKRWPLEVLMAACCLLSCSGDPRFNQYYAEGEQLYARHCSNCHQKDGKGLGLVYPPLATSDFMDNRVDEVLCLMKKGRSG